MGQKSDSLLSRENGHQRKTEPKKACAKPVALGNRRIEVWSNSNARDSSSSNGISYTISQVMDRGPLLPLEKSLRWLSEARTGEPRGTEQNSCSHYGEGVRPPGGQEP